MLRVAFVITELDVGGAERQLTQLATGIDRRFFKPRVYALGEPPRPPREELVRQLQAAEVPVEFLGARRWFHFGPTVERLTERLREFQPHIVQSFLFHANVIGTLAARDAGIPAVMGIRVAQPSWWRSRVERHVARHAQRVVSVSQGVAAFARRTLRLRDEQCVVIPNGIDLNVVELSQGADLTLLGIPAGVRPITFVGRIDRQKGADRLAELLPVVAALQTHLLIVGDGPLRTRLEQRFRHLDDAHRVHFAGWQADVPAILKESQLLVLPSRYEGMPNVVLEAMAAGLPVVVTPVEGVAELLGPEADGQIAPYEPQRWAAAIARLASQADVAKTLGERNRQRVADHFGAQAMVTAYERLYSGLAAHQRSV